MKNSSGSNPLILLVEGDDDVAGTTGQLLEVEGYRMRRVPDAVQAQLYFTELASSGGPLPDLVLLGNLVHEERAVEFLNWLDAQAGKALPIILFSALPASRLKALAQRIRAVGIVVKPFDANDLIRVVKGAIRAGSSSDSPSALE